MRDRRTACNWSTMDHMERSLTRPSLSGMKGDPRWKRWIAKGDAHDARLRDRVRVVGMSLVSLIALGLAVALTVR